MKHIAFVAVAVVALAGCSSTSESVVQQQLRQVSEACGAKFGYSNEAFYQCRQQGTAKLPGYIGSGNDAIAQIRGDRSTSKACPAAPGVAPTFNC